MPIAIACQSAWTYGNLPAPDSGEIGSQSVITYQLWPASLLRIMARFPPAKTRLWFVGSTMIAWLYQAWSCITSRSGWSFVAFSGQPGCPIAMQMLAELALRLVQPWPPLVERKMSLCAPPFAVAASR